MDIAKISYDTAVAQLHKYNSEKTFDISANELDRFYRFKDANVTDLRRKVTEAIVHAYLDGNLTQSHAITVWMGDNRRFNREIMDV